MKRSTILFVVFAAAALLVGVVVPYLVHRAGSSAVPGWEGLVDPGPISKAHQFIAGSCESCHTPHVGVDPQKCIACHATTSFADKQSTRFHVNAKRCASCHVEHDGGVSLSRMDHDALTLAKFWKVPAHTVFRATAKGRPPKAGGMSHPTHPTINGDLARLDCASCHSNSDPHQGLFGAQCSSCHALTTWRIAEFRHPSTRSTECSQCHLPPPSHNMMHFEMVSQRVAGKRARVEQCYACHTTDAWNNIRGVGWYVHH